MDWVGWWFWVRNAVSVVTGVGLFVWGWTYATQAYGLFLGIGLCWFPALVIAALGYFIMKLCWPYGLVAAFVGLVTLVKGPWSRAVQAAANDRWPGLWTNGTGEGRSTTVCANVAVPAPATVSLWKG